MSCFELHSRLVCFKVEHLGSNAWLIMGEYIHERCDGAVASERTRVGESETASGGSADCGPALGRRTGSGPFDRASDGERRKPSGVISFLPAKDSCPKRDEDVLVHEVDIPCAGCAFDYTAHQAVSLSRVVERCAGLGNEGIVLEKIQPGLDGIVKMFRVADFWIIL